MNALLNRIAKDISETFAGARRSEEERYLAQATDISDVERRIRELERAQAARLL